MRGLSRDQLQQTNVVVEPISGAPKSATQLGERRWHGTGKRVEQFLPHRRGEDLHLVEPGDDPAWGTYGPSLEMIDD